MAKFRKYPTWQGGIDDHANFFVVNKRYADALKVRGDSKAFAVAIAKAGYATAPNYANSIIAVIDCHNLTQYDIHPTANTTI